MSLLFLQQIVNKRKNRVADTSSKMLEDELRVLSFSRRIRDYPRASLLPTTADIELFARINVFDAVPTSVQIHSNQQLSTLTRKLRFQHDVTSSEYSNQGASEARL